MGPLSDSEILKAVLRGLLLATLFGALASWGWAIGKLFRREALLPESPIVRRRTPPWGLGTILLILAAYVFASRDAFERFAPANRAEPPKAQAEAPARVEKEKDGGSGPEGAKEDRSGGAPQEPGLKAPEEPGSRPPAGPAAEEAESLPHGLSLIELMSIQGGLNAAFILLLPFLARLTSGARLRDLGLSSRGWPQQAGIGLVAVLFLMPIVYTVQVACVSYLDMPVREMEKHKHPLEKMLMEGLSPGVAALAVLTAVVLAPIFEELLFRGFIQSWLVKLFNQVTDRPRPASSHRGVSAPSPEQASMLDPAPGEVSQPGTETAMSLTDPAADRFRTQDGGDIPPRESIRLGDSTPRPPESCDSRSSPGSGIGTGVAIVITSFVFAILHAAQWPAPIPLFLLAIGLGVVYQRTGSLIAPICMHAVFNGFSTLMLFYAALEQHDQRKPEARPVLERVVPAEKSGQVAPGSAPGRSRGKT